MLTDKAKCSEDSPKSMKHKSNWKVKNNNSKLKARMIFQWHEFHPLFLRDCLLQGAKRKLDILYILSS